MAKKCLPVHKEWIMDVCLQLFVKQIAFQLTQRNKLGRQKKRIFIQSRLVWLSEIIIPYSRQQSISVLRNSFIVHPQHIKHITMANSINTNQYFIGFVQ